MNKFWKIAGVVAVLVAVVGFVGVPATFAQGPNQPDDFTPRGRTQIQDNANAGMGLMAVDETIMHAAIAEALDMSIEEFEAAIAEGKTPFILAQELGIDFAEVQAAMDAVHTDALQQAVNEGLITQEQANWMLSHRGGQNGQGNGLNGGLSDSPMGGRGQGNHSGNNGDCIYQTP
jgi:hypothetical protein